MKTLLKTAALAMFLAMPLAHAAEGDAAPKAAQPTAAAPAADYTYKTPKLKRAQIDALLAKPAKLLILDVRRPDELSKIGGFPVYLSIQAKEVEKSLAFIPKDRAIVTVSNRAHRAGATADLLAGKGYKVVGAIGVEDYAEEGGTLTKIAPPPPRTDAAAAQPAQPAQPAKP